MRVRLHGGLETFRARSEEYTCASAHVVRRYSKKVCVHSMVRPVESESLNLDRLYAYRNSEKAGELA